MLNGFLNINKPKGITSFDVIRMVRRIKFGEKIGHTGTLDPLASGVLVLVFGEATKLIEFIVKADKEYEAQITLGAASVTYDAEGEIKKISEKRPLKREVEDGLRVFKGDIFQTPPKFSAIKVKGKKAYELARKGIEVNLKKRKIHIYSIKILKYEYPNLKIKVMCSSGTYIRSLAHEIGLKLQTGAYLSGLKRTRSGGFLIKNAVSPEDLNTQNLKQKLEPVEKYVKLFPKIILNSIEYKKLNFGQTISRPKLKEGIDLFMGFYKNSLAGILEKVKDSGSKDSQNLLKYYKKLNID
ncbi:tRNA pseudouridine(55) synthase TruB [Candidatus Peregrinibacteria bacterium]|nr:tRNA pseudouridine(55) synthase TruB [Candidatus Peregrinibacteria bacterium]